MLLTENVTQKWNNKTKKHYIELGYEFTKNGQEFIVSVHHLTKGSAVRVDVKCDFCDTIKNIQYGTYLVSKEAEHTGHIDCCKKCIAKKNEYFYLAEYGVKHNWSTEENLASRTNNIEDIRDNLKSRNLTLISEEYTHCSVKLEFVCNTHIEKGIQSLSWTELNRGYDCKFCSFDEHSERMKGSNNPNYNENLTDEDRNRQRLEDGYYHWSKDVRQRDGNKCVICSSGESTVAHHLDGYHWCKEKRTDINNGVTLCREHHVHFHSTYGNRNNTKEQFYEYLSAEKGDGKQ